MKSRFLNYTFIVTYDIRMRFVSGTDILRHVTLDYKFDNILIVGL